MVVTIGKQYYVVQWQHIDDPIQTNDFVASHPDLRRKIGRYTGMTICRIKVPNEHPADDDSRKLMTVLEGYSFRHKSEPTYDKKSGRRHSLQNTLQGQLTVEARREFWVVFNAIWPPVRPDMNVWQRKYEALAANQRGLQLRLSKLTVRLEAALQAGGARTLSADDKAFPG